MHGWRSWLTSLGLGLLGALVGFWIFHGLFGIGDTNKFDWGGIVGAVIGAIIVVAVASFLVKRFAKHHPVEEPTRGLSRRRGATMTTAQRPHWGRAARTARAGDGIEPARPAWKVGAVASRVTWADIVPGQWRGVLVSDRS